MNITEAIFYLIKFPVVLITLAVFLIFKIFPPKSINSWYGYRTKRSMSSEMKWEFAQKYSANLSIMVISIVLVIQCILYLLFNSSTVTDLSVFGIWLVGMAIVIITVEGKLKDLKE